MDTDPRFISGISANHSIEDRLAQRTRRVSSEIALTLTLGPALRRITEGSHGLSEYPRLPEFVNPTSPVSYSGVLQATRKAIHEHGVTVAVDHVLYLAEHPSHTLGR